MENKRIVSNIFWRLAEKWGAQGVTFIVSIVLARLLEPQLYGTIALVTVFTTIAQVFVDSGMGVALVQKRDVDEVDFSTVFYFNLFSCTLLYIILYFAAPFIASFYNNNQLISIIRVLSLSLIIYGLKNVQQAYVTKTFQFKKFFYSTSIGTIGAAILGISMAYLGFGVWALVFQGLFNTALDTIILWFTVKWRPKKVFSFERLKTLMDFGFKMFLVSFFDAIYNEISQLIIGKKYSSADLAQYNRGRQFPVLIVSNINGAIENVLFPVMSEVQNNPAKVKKFTRLSIKLSTYIMAPVMIGLAIVSPNLIRILLTDKWIECVPYLQVFCIAFIFLPIHTANLNAIKSMGKGSLILKLDIVKKIICIIIIVISSHFGVYAICLSSLLTSIVNQIINSLPNRKLLDYGYFEQLIDLLPTFILTAFMGTVVWIVGKVNCNIYLSLGCQIVTGVAFYYFVSKTLQLEPFKYIVAIINDYRKKK